MRSIQWNSDEIEELQGKIIVVTGSNSGIGLETARVLALKKATVIMAIRNLEKGRAAAEKIVSQAEDAQVKVMEMDLADLASVQRFAKAFMDRFDRLDILINNAGVMIPPYAKTKDGFELQFGTNHLGHFALTGLLIDLINKTPDSRVISVSSMAHRIGSINFDDLHWDNRPYKKWQAYGDSKIANLYFIYCLKQKLEKDASHVIAAAAHPGYTATELQRHTGFFSAMNHVFAQAISMGALPTLYAATAPDVMSGDFFGPSGFMEIRGYPKKVSSNSLSRNREIADRLWEVSESLTGIRFPDTK